MFLNVFCFGVCRVLIDLVASVVLPCEWSKNKFHVSEIHFNLCRAQFSFPSGALRDAVFGLVGPVPTSDSIIC